MKENVSREQGKREKSEREKHLYFKKFESEEEFLIHQVKLFKTSLDEINPFV